MRGGGRRCTGCVENPSEIECEGYLRFVGGALGGGEGGMGNG